MNGSMVRINVGWWIGFVISIWASYTMWGYLGVLFTFGLSMQTGETFFLVLRGDK